MFEIPGSEAPRTKEYNLEDYDLDGATFTINSDGTLTVRLSQEQFAELNEEINKNNESDKGKAEAIERCDQHESKIIEMLKDKKLTLSQVHTELLNPDINLDRENLRIYLGHLVDEGVLTIEFDDPTDDDPTYSYVGE